MYMHTPKGYKFVEYEPEDVYLTWYCLHCDVQNESLYFKGDVMTQCEECGLTMFWSTIFQPYIEAEIARDDAELDQWLNDIPY